MCKVTLQVNLSPLDYPKVIHLLPHQLKTFADQCDELLVILDLKKSSSKKSSGIRWDLNTQPILDFINSTKKSLYPQLRIEVVDYSDNIRKCMSKTVMRRGRIPDKDYSGGPFYSYYYGIYVSSNDYVLHIDADMMFGGRDKNWIKSAISVLKNDSNIFSCSPLAGPPILNNKQLPSMYRKKFNPVRTYNFPGSYLYTHFSTRVFLLHKYNLYKKISVQYPNFDHFVKAVFRGASPYRYPEGTITDMIKKKHLYRLDFSGELPGLWCLHPNGDPHLLEVLPEILFLLERNQFPDSQRGFCDINNEFLDHAARLKKGLFSHNQIA